MERVVASHLLAWDPGLTIRLSEPQKCHGPMEKKKSFRLEINEEHANHERVS